MCACAAVPGSRAVLSATRAMAAAAPSVRGRASALERGGSEPDYYPHGLTSLSPACPVERVLEGLGSFREEPLAGTSAYVRPTSLLFAQGGKQRRWDAVQAHDSVAAVLYHTQRQAFVIVRQWRPPVYAVRWRAAAAACKPPPAPAAGLSYELCAGILDKPGLALEQVCAEEVLEEVGYALRPEQLTRCAGALVSSAGITGSRQSVFFAQVDEACRACEGGGTQAELERVEALALPLAGVDAFLADEQLAKTPGLAFGLLWGRAWLQRSGSG